MARIETGSMGGGGSEVNKEELSLELEITPSNDENPPTPEAIIAAGTTDITNLVEKQTTPEKSSFDIEKWRKNLTEEQDKALGVIIEKIQRGNMIGGAELGRKVICTPNDMNRHIYVYGQVNMLTLPYEDISLMIETLIKTYYTGKNDHEKLVKDAAGNIDRLISLEHHRKTY